MFTRSEKTYLILTLVFLAAGSGIKAWRKSTIRIGPFPDTTTAALDSARAFPIPGTLPTSIPDSLPHALDTLAVQNTMADGHDSPAGHEPAAAAPQVNDPSIGSTARGPASRAKASQDAAKVDLNRADAVALTRVKGIGAKTAEAIVEHRRAHGAYRNLRDLLQVKGIGEKKLEKLTPYLIL